MEAVRKNKDLVRALLPIPPFAQILLQQKAFDDAAVERRPSTDQVLRIAKEVKVDANIKRVEVKSMCPALLVICSGIAVAPDGSRCDLPIPPINRALGRKRLIDFQDSIETGFRHGDMKEQVSMVPYSWTTKIESPGGLALVHPNRASFVPFVGEPVTTGLNPRSVEALVGAFECSGQFEEGSSSVEIFASMLTLIQERFNRFATENDFRSFTFCLLQVWQTKFENSVPTPACWCPTSQTVLLAKLLWVLLDFPILAPVEGLARTFIANRIYLGDEAANDDTLKSLSTNDFTVHLLGIQGSLDVASSTVFLQYSLDCQSRIDNSATTTLPDILSYFLATLRFDITGEQASHIFSHPNAAQYDREDGKQAYKLLQGISELIEAGGGNRFLNAYFNGNGLNWKQIVKVKRYKNSEKKKKTKAGHIWLRSNALAFHL